MCVCVVLSTSLSCLLNHLVIVSCLMILGPGLGCVLLSPIYLLSSIPSSGLPAFLMFTFLLSFIHLIFFGGACVILLPEMIIFPVLVSPSVLSW